MSKKNTTTPSKETLAALAELEEICRPSGTPLHRVLGDLAKELRRSGPHTRPVWIRLAENDAGMRGRLENLVAWIDNNLPELREAAKGS